MGNMSDKDYREKTISYYDNHSEEYAQTTYAADMEDYYQRFLKYVPKGGSIVDIGCGSGRDMKHFAEAGFSVSGVDASEGMCRVAHEYSGFPVVCCDALAWEPETEYDAIWANGSLLHLRKDEIVTFIKTKCEFLKPGGILYFSMKAGIPEGYDENGRYFTPFSESIVDSVLADGKLALQERWVENDSLGREGFYWEAIILRKNNIQGRRNQGLRIIL